MKEVTVQIVNNSSNLIPNYAKVGDSGMDVRVEINGKNGGTKDVNGYFVDMIPGMRYMFHTGQYMAIPDGYEMQVRPRSGMAIKQGITVINSPGTIDSGYRGECNVLAINHGNSTIRIYSGERIAQWVLQEVPKVRWSVVEELDDSDRGTGGFGSTGKD